MSMTTLALKPAADYPRAARSEPAEPARPLAELTSPLSSLAASSSSLLDKPFGLIESGGREYALPRYLFIGPKGGDDPIRVGLFAGLHGDQPETTRALAGFLAELEGEPEPARNYFLFAYPGCNPTGLEDGTRASRRGRDLNREFWNNSAEPETALLQSEICSHALHGVIALHADAESPGFYGFARNPVFARTLLEPALAAAEAALPRNRAAVIDGFAARNGVIRGGRLGSVSGPPQIRPRPFEIALCSPQQAAPELQARAFALALKAVLERYREFMGHAPNL